jgi:hypothetical protein
VGVEKMVDVEVVRDLKNSEESNHGLLQATFAIVLFNPARVDRKTKGREKTPSALQLSRSSPS